MAKEYNKIVIHLTDEHFKKITEFMNSLPYPVPVSSYARQLLLEKIDELQKKPETLGQ